MHAWVGIYIPTYIPKFRSSCSICMHGVYFLYTYVHTKCTLSDSINTVCTHAHSHMHIYIYTHSLSHSDTLTCTHACTCTYVHTHTHLMHASAGISFPCTIYTYSLPKFLNYMLIKYNWYTHRHPFSIQEYP